MQSRTLGKGRDGNRRDGTGLEGTGLEGTIRDRTGQARTKSDRAGQGKAGWDGLTQSLSLRMRFIWMERGWDAKRWDGMELRREKEG